MMFVVTVVNIIYHILILSCDPSYAAGKTTTINILTGALAASEGTAVISGKDIRTSMQQIRQDMGICLQHDALDKSLTVRQHIELFARIKGLYARISREEADKKIDQLLRDVALFDKSNTLSKNLSGGMKRKLSLAMAFCGGSKVVILDEPTSGMDPFSRRFTWNLIRQYRQNRTIILTTHFMEEADILGDKIVIMAEGKVRCCGSSLFLKQKYGVGYQLTVEKKKSQFQPRISKDLLMNRDIESAQENSASQPAEDDYITTLVKGNVREANVLSNIATELKFQLPLRASSNFVPMLQSLDQAVANGTISSYGLGFTTLEEVFILVSRGDSGGGDEEAVRQAIESSKRQSTSLDSSMDLTQKDFDRDGLFMRHVLCLIWKRWSNFKRDKKAWFFTMVLPSLFVLIGLILFDSLDVLALWFLIVL